MSNRTATSHICLFIALAALCMIASRPEPAAAQATTANAPGFVALSDVQFKNFESLFGTPPQPEDKSSLAAFLNSAFRVALSVGAILAVLRIAYAGYLYMGNDMWSHKSKAKEILGDIVLGVLLLLSIWLILKQINPDILNLDILRNVKQAPSTTAPVTTTPSPTNTTSATPYDPADPGLSPCPPGMHDGGPSVSHGCLPD